MRLNDIRKIHNNNLRRGNMFKKAAILALSVVLLTALCVSTAAASSHKKAEAAADWKFHDIVDVEFVQKYAKVPMAEDVMIIDSRPKRGKYDKGHIPMAVSIPDREFDKMIEQLPANKEATLIFYCQGLK